jgi:hypothetical protein
MGHYAWPLQALTIGETGTQSRAASVAAMLRRVNARSVRRPFYGSRKA